MNNEILEGLDNPVYKTTTKYNGKSVAVYNMDNHINKTNLSRFSIIVEVDGDEEVSIVAPSSVIKGMHFDEFDNVNSYLETQDNSRNKIEKFSKIFDMVKYMIVFAIYTVLILVLDLDIGVIQLLLIGVIVVLLFTVIKQKVKKHMIFDNYKVYLEGVKTPNINQDLDIMLDDIRTNEYISSISANRFAIIFSQINKKLK